MKEQLLMTIRWLRSGGLMTAGLTVLVVVLWGEIIWNNLRPDDPFLEGWQPYEQAAFEEAVAAGGPVIVEVYASWCPVCIAQHQSFEKVWAQTDYPNVTAFRVDFEADKEFVRTNGIAGTGILLHYRDGEELERIGGLTTEREVKTFLNRAAY